MDPALEQLFSLRTSGGSEHVGQAIATSVDALRWSSDPGHILLTPDQPTYPAVLRHTDDAPVVLYANGNLERLTTNCLAIVGTRHPTADGMANAQAFAFSLAKRGWCIVSGLANGIDGAAHQGALKAGLRAASTVAVLGTGIDTIYPRTHTRLAQEIVARFHSQAAAEEALQDFELRSKGGIPDEVPAMTIQIAEASIAVPQLLKQVGLVASTSEAIRAIEQGGVKLDGEKVIDKHHQVAKGVELVAQVGKRKFMRITIN